MKTWPPTFLGKPWEYDTCLKPLTEWEGGYYQWNLGFESDLFWTLGPVPSFWGSVIWVSMSSSAEWMNTYLLGCVTERNNVPKALRMAPVQCRSGCLSYPFLSRGCGGRAGGWVLIFLQDRSPSAAEQVFLHCCNFRRGDIFLADKLMVSGTLLALKGGKYINHLCQPLHCTKK